MPHMSIGGVLASIIQLEVMLIIVWCLLSWFPNIRWYDQPWKTLDKVVQPVIGPFRQIIPPISGIDLSPMIAIMLLQALGSALRNFL